MNNLIREAALGPIRCITDLEKAELRDVRQMNFNDFIKALCQVRASVSDKDLQLYLNYDRDFGSKNG